MTVPPRIMRVAAWQDAHPRLVDAAVAVLICLLNIPLGLETLDHEGPSVDSSATRLVSVAAIVVVGTALLLRRRYPLAVWLVTSLTLPVALLGSEQLLDLSFEQKRQLFTSLPTLNLLAVPLTVGTVTTHRAMRLGLLAFLVSTAAETATVSTLYPVKSMQDLFFNIFPFALVNLIGLLTGTLLRVHRQTLEDTKAYAARAALASEQRALLAAATERSRIAREMHDVIAHSLAVMITMADGAAATIDRSPERAKEALGVLTETGRSALADTRRLVGVLREDPGASSAGDDGAVLRGAATATPPPPALGPAPASAPQVRDLPVPEFAPPGTVVPVEPSAPIADLRAAATTGQDTSTGGTPTAPAPESADLEVLVQRFKTAGVPVTYTWNGAPLPDDKGLQLTLFRIAQEALTNVLRYAPTTRSVKVQVDRHTGTVVLLVQNDAAPGSTPMHGSGKGLIGMRERAAVYGGQLQAGPTAQGWQVRAILRWDETDEGSTSWQRPS